MTDLTHVHQMWDDDGASRTLGIELLSVEHDGRVGRARTRMTVTEIMVNGHGTMHGGYIFAFADSTFALACNAGGETTVAAGCDIDFVKAVSLGEVLLAEGVEQVRYGRNGITDVTVTRESDGALIAHFRGRSRALRTRPTP